MMEEQEKESEDINIDINKIKTMVKKNPHIFIYAGFLLLMFLMLYYNGLAIEGCNAYYQDILNNMSYAPSRWTMLI